MIEAYVLVETMVGKAQEMAHRFETFDETVHADVVTGSYDVLARIRATTIEELADVAERMKSFEGVTRTLLCPVTHEDVAAHLGWQPLHAPV